MKIITDRYDGITIDPTTLPETTNEFEMEVNLLLSNINDEKLLWIKIPINKSAYIPILTNLDFEYHHCDNNSLMLVKKLKNNSFIPAAKNYTVGVGAIVRDGNKILVVKDRFYNGYKLPGGHVDNNENIKDALVREVFEETGIRIEFESISNLGHFTRAQFDTSNIYIVCTAVPLTKDIQIYDTTEIIEAKWIDVDTYLSSNDVNNYNKSVVRSVVENRELKLTDQDIKMKVPGEVFF